MALWIMLLSFRERPVQRGKASAAGESRRREKTPLSDRASVAKVASKRSAQSHSSQYKYDLSGWKIKESGWTVALFGACVLLYNKSG